MKLKSACKCRFMVSIRSAYEYKDTVQKALYRSRMSNETTPIVLDERVVQRDVRWGDAITVGPLNGDSCMIVTLSDSSTVTIPFPPSLAEGEKKDWQENWPTAGEAAYLVDGSSRTGNMRQCLIRWEAVPYENTPDTARFRFFSIKYLEIINCNCSSNLIFLFMSLFSLLFGLFWCWILSSNIYT